MTGNGATTTIPTGADLDRLRFLRTKLEHEDDLINHRLSWLMASQALFATAYVLAFGADNEFPSGLAKGIPVLGLVTVVLNEISVLAAIVAIVRLRKQWAAFRPAHATEITSGTTVTGVAGFVAPVGVPVAMVIAWIVALAHPGPPG